MKGEETTPIVKGENKRLLLLHSPQMEDPTIPTNYDIELIKKEVSKNPVTVFTVDAEHQLTDPNFKDVQEVLSEYGYGDKGTGAWVKLDSMKEDAGLVPRFSVIFILLSYNV